MTATVDDSTKTNLKRKQNPDKDSAPKKNKVSKPTTTKKSFSAKSTGTKTKNFTQKGKFHKNGKEVKQFKPGIKTNTKLPKETAQSRKQRKLLRKQRKPNYELSHKAKKIWEKLRIQKGDLSKKEKSELVESLMSLVTDKNKKLLDLCYAHDTSRVVQTCLKQGQREQREKVFAELKDHIVPLCKSRFAKNIVWKMIKYSTPEERNMIFKVLIKDAYRLMKSPTSATVVEYAYNNFANAQQRFLLVKQLYGRVFCNYQIDDSITFSEMLASNPEKKESMLVSFKTSLEPFAEKQGLTCTLIHKAMKDFFDVCDDAKLRSEMIEVLRDSLVHMMHTREGAHVSMECLWHGTKKDRKAIVKTMKEFVEKLSCEEFGHLVMLAAFDCVDDTVQTKKALIQPLMKHVEEVITNKYGRKVLLYLIAFRNKSHFVPSVVQVLSHGDDNVSSKKPMEQRRRELSEAVSPSMIEYVASNMEECVFNHSRFVFVDAVYLHCIGDFSAFSQNLLNLLSEPFEPNASSNGHLHVVEDPCGHIVIKRIIKGDPDTVSSGNESSFSRMILNEISVDSLVSWSTCNRGTQILLALVESRDEEVSEKAKKLLRQKRSSLKKISTFSSSKILLEKLQ